MLRLEAPLIEPDKTVGATPSLRSQLLCLGSWKPAHSCISFVPSPPIVMSREFFSAQNPFLDFGPDKVFPCLCEAMRSWSLYLPEVHGEVSQLPRPDRKKV